MRHRTRRRVFWLLVFGLIVLALFAVRAGAEPPAPSPETWLTIRALSAETQALEERFGRLNAEMVVVRQAFIERKAQWDAAVAELAKIMKMDAAVCTPDPASRTWVPRRPDVKECVKAP